VAFQPANFLLGIPGTVYGAIVSTGSAPAITSDGGGATADVSVNTGDTAVTTVTATGTGTETFSIVGGAEAGMFTINPASGALAFAATSVDGEYTVIVKAVNDWGSDTQTITVTVEAGGYHADAVHFDDAKFVSNAATIADSRLGLFSFWVDWPNMTASAIVIVRESTGGLWTITIVNEGLGSGTVICSFIGTLGEEFTFEVNPTTVPEGWANVLVAVDTNHPAGQKIGQITIGRISQTVTVTGDESAAFDIDWGDALQIGQTGASPPRVFDVAEVYENFAEYLDVSQTSVMDKFSDSSGKPISLGADGSLPTGTQPAVYGAGNAAAFMAPNLGSAGAFTKTGSVTNSSTSPSD
jgi:hypothetical protein